MRAECKEKNEMEDIKSAGYKEEEI